MIAEAKEEIKIPAIGDQVGTRVFKVQGKFYHGRLEEAKKYYTKHSEIWDRYSFFEFVKLTYTVYKQPKRFVKQEILDICVKSMPPSDITKIMCLLNKL